MSRIQGAVAAITGAGSGIGRALALELARGGAQLALADVNPESLAETQKQLGRAPSRTYVVDVAHRAAVEQFAADVERDFGRASLLVNNAGVALYGTFAELTIDEFAWLIGINFWGVIHGCKFFLRLLEREAEAHIVNISSVFGLIAPPGQSAYCSSKFAVRGFSDCLREELRPKGIRVTCVHPAGIATRIAEKARAGAATQNQDLDMVRREYTKALTIPAEEAARVIVKGIRENQDRVLIGKDAYRIDRLQRLMPIRANAILSNWLRRRVERNIAKSSETVKN